MMTNKSWDEWVKTIADEYEVNLDPAQRQTQKQKQILEAAIHVFAEKGYSGASTHEIAERAGVAEATIFKHYRTKKGLLLRLVVPAIAKVAEVPTTTAVTLLWVISISKAAATTPTPIDTAARIHSCFSPGYQ